MLASMDKFELGQYKSLSLNERINDKEIQLIHLAKVCAYDHQELFDCINTFSKKNQKEIKSFLSDNSPPPY